MTDKERYVKQAFKNYKENKKLLKSLLFDGIRAVDYSKLRTSTHNETGIENAIINHISKKELIENQIRLVDRVVWYYELDGGTKLEFIRLKLKGYLLYRVAMECYISNGTAIRWNKEILETAARVVDLFNLF